MGLDKEDRRLWQTVLRTIRPFPLTSPQTKLLVGVSGGADSLALLHFLQYQLGAERLVVAHVNHDLRSEADDEAQFVTSTAAAWQIPLVSTKIAVAEVAQTSGVSLETAGRQVRYQYFAQQAKKVGATAVAVGHHADDQAETILLHLLRGSGSAGLRGMRPVSRVPVHEDVPLLRPFLYITRAEIEAYCARNHLNPRQDSSNQDVQFVRNRIRHELLPLLQTYNPQLTTRLQQLAIITADEYAAQIATFNQIWPTLLLMQGNGWLVLNRKVFARQPVAWQRLALRRAVQQLRPLIADVGFQTVEQARLLILDRQSGSEATLPGGLIMRVEAQELIFGDAAAERPRPVPQLDVAQPIHLPVPGWVDLANGWRVIADLRSDVPLDLVHQNNDPWQAFVSLAEGESLWLRPFALDERFQPLGMGGRSQAIQDLLSNRKVARRQRPFWPVVATTNHPIWIVGLHLDERARLTAQSRSMVHLICQPAAPP